MPGPQQQPAEELTGKTIGRFLVGARLGAGGMGEVYRATDTKLKRVVALKRLAPKLRADADYHRRFLKEAERVAHLSHQRIAALYDVLEEQGELFLVMEYVEGQTLRQRLSAEITLDECLEIAVQCAEGLSAAHEQGVLHLDIKPENFMLATSGPAQVKILDFGVARRLPQAEAGLATATGSGAAIEESLSGTVVYMAPEVLLKKQADERADIFSLGLVFFECLTGRHPFLTGSVIATAGRILHEAAPPVRQWNPRVPAEMERIVAKMLAKDPAERYATTRDLLVDLRAVQRGSGSGAHLPESVRRGGLTPKQISPRFAALWAAVLAGLVLAALLVYQWSQHRKVAQEGNAAPVEKLVAVLPFTVPGGDPKTIAFSDGLTETLSAKLTQLTRSQGLQVAPSSLVRERKVTGVEQAAYDLGVNLVITGSLQQAGDMLRVNINLVDVRSRRQLRSESFDTASGDPFALQDRVVTVLLSMLELQPQDAERRILAARGTKVAVAEDFYLEGRGYLRNYDKGENIDSAIAVFQNALRLDPRYALAHAGLGSAFWYKFQAANDPQWAEKAAGSCREAVRLDSRQAPGHVCLGTVYAGKGRYTEAVSEFSEATQLEPTSDEGFRGLAKAYEKQGKLEEAERTYRAAINMRPRYWAGYSALGGFYFVRARYKEAAAMFEQAVALAPDSYRERSNLGAIYIMQGRYAQAVPVLERSLAIHPTAGAFSNLGTAYFYLRQFEKAVRNCEEAIRLGDHRYVAWGNLGDAYYYDGNPDHRDRARTAYRRALELAQESLRVNPQDTALLASGANYLSKLGEKEKALASLRQALQPAKPDPEILFKAAVVYNNLGEPSVALEWLEKALAAGFSRAVVENTAELDNLRGQARFRELVQGR